MDRRHFLTFISAASSDLAIQKSALAQIGSPELNSGWVPASGGAAGQTIAIQQNWVSTEVGASTSVTQSYSVNPTAANLLVVVGYAVNTTGTISVADNIGDTATWAIAVGPFNWSNVSFNGLGYIFYKVVSGTPTGKGISITYSGAASQLAIFQAEYKNNATTSVLDGTPVTNLNTTQTTSVQADSAGVGITTTTPGKGLVMAFFQASSPNTLTAGLNYTVERTDPSIQADFIIDRIAVAGTYNANGTISASSRYGAMSAAFKAHP